MPSPLLKHDLMCKKIDEWSRWDALREKYGPQVMRLTLLMPIIGYMALFNEYFVLNMKLSEELVPGSNAFSDLRLFLIYFGLVFYAVGSGIFRFRCPPAVRAHGSAWEFVASEGAHMSDVRYSNIVKQVLVARYSGRVRGDGIDLAKAFASRPEGRPMLKFFADTRIMADETKLALRSLDNEYDDALRTSEFRRNWLHEWFVPQKHWYPRWRFACWALFWSGTIALGIPAVELFARVCLSFYPVLMRLVA